MSAWISATTNPPTEGVYVLIKTKTGLVRIAKRVVYKDNSERYSYSSTYFEPMWWQPLPK